MNEKAKQARSSWLGFARTVVLHPWQTLKIGTQYCAYLTADCPYCAPCALQIHNPEFYPPVTCSAFRRFVISNRLGVAEAIGDDPFRRDAFLHQIDFHCFGAGARQNQVVVWIALIIGMADNLDVLVSEPDDALGNRIEKTLSNTCMVV